LAQGSARCRHETAAPAALLNHVGSPDYFLAETFGRLGRAVAGE
jgi:hypothetical protein